MSESGTAYKFELPKHHQSIIKVIGVGGGGSNAVNHMFRLGIKDVEFVVCNTDLQALNSSPVPYKLQIGTNLTEGLGCGANPEVGKAAALESKDHIREMLTGTKMVFVTAGMGGGTGTGAAPVLAKIAKDMDILTVGIVTVPFMFEGKKKLAQARLGVEALRASCDTMLVILNDQLREIYGNLSIGQAFAEADNILTTASKGIAEIITLAGYVNVDFQDVRTVMHNAGTAVMGSAETRGDNRASQAAEEALASPLLDNRDIMGAKRILLSIISGEEAELQMDELTQITEIIQEQAGDDAEVIFGHGIDPTIGDRIRITVIATDFTNERKLMPSVEEETKVHDLEKPHPSLFDQMDNSVNERNDEVELKTISHFDPELTDSKEEPVLKNEIEVKEEAIEEEAKAEDVEERGYTFTLFEKENAPIVENSLEDEEDEEDEKEGEKDLFSKEEDEFELGKEVFSDQIIDDQDMMEYRMTKERLEQQAIERREKIKQGEKQEMTKEEFNEKWSLPAYLRRGVKMSNVPHSSESYISRYNLNDDNNLLGNNKFLHDNVD